MITYLGELTLSASMPGAAAAASAGISGINGALPDIQARIAALQAFQPTDINFQAQLVLAQQIVASVQQSISLGLPAPSIAAQIALAMSVMNDLLAMVTSVNASLSVVVGFQTLLFADGVQALAYDGAVANLGSELDGALVGVLPPGDHANAVVLVTTIPATWDAMTGIFKVTP